MLTIELTGTDTATCDGIKVTNRNGPIGKLARKLIEKGHDSDLSVGVYRNGTKCFEDARLGRWADTATSETDRQSVRFTPYVPFSAKAVGHTSA